MTDYKTIQGGITANANLPTSDLYGLPLYQNILINNFNDAYYDLINQNTYSKTRFIDASNDYYNVLKLVPALDSSINYLTNQEIAFKNENDFLVNLANGSSSIIGSSLVKSQIAAIDISINDISNNQIPYNIGSSQYYSKNYLQKLSDLNKATQQYDASYNLNADIINKYHDLNTNFDYYVKQKNGGHMYYNVKLQNQVFERNENDIVQAFSVYDKTYETLNQNIQNYYTLNLYILVFYYIVVLGIVYLLFLNKRGFPLVIRFLILAFFCAYPFISLGLAKYGAYFITFIQSLVTGNAFVARK